MLEEKIRNVLSDLKLGVINDDMLVFNKNTGYKVIKPTVTINITLQDGKQAIMDISEYFKEDL